MSQLLSPKQVARALAVSESSLKRWCDRGLLRFTKTGGGHRRLSLDAVLRFARKTGRDLAHPELLGLPARVGHGERTLRAARDDYFTALLAGDEARCRQILLDLHLADRPLSQVGDEIVGQAFHQVGDAWSCGSAEIYQERRAIETCLRALGDIRRMLPQSTADAPLAIGAAPECDPYALPNALVELVLRQRGWEAHALGSGLPFSTLIRAIEQMRPRLFWLSVSHIEDEPQFLREYGQFFQAVKDKVVIVVGGRALAEPLRRQMQYNAFCDNLQHLEGFANAAWPSKA
jgi:MerR family transcriptional regulator, light-induced transcriptional regulator